VRAIFLSYRRDDAEGEAGRLFDDLIAGFGRGKVFMDVTGIEPGRDFRKVIDQNVASCGVLLAMIGKDWIDAKDDAGRRRLDDPLDFVRLETASALRRDIPVIPVLVHGGRLPRPEQLPEDLKDLVYRNAVELSHARWDSDVQLLIKALRPHVDMEPEEVSGARAKPALNRSIGQDITLDSKVAEVGRTTFATQIQPTKRFWRVTVVAAVASIVIAAGGVGLPEYKKTEDAKVKKAATEAASRQAAEDQKVAAEKEAARKAAEERAAAEQAAARKAAAQKVAAAEQAAARKAAEERAAAEQAAARKVAAQKVTAAELAAARKAAESGTIANTTWRFAGSPGRQGQSFVRFLPNGTFELFYILPNGTVRPSPGDDRWTQSGSRVVFNANGYTEFDVTVSNNRMHGIWRRLRGPDRGLTHSTDLLLEKGRS
jgi:hypothetical protein